MNAIAATTLAVRKKGGLRTKLLNPVVCSIGATIGIFGGISALIAGFFCVILHSLLSKDEVFDAVGTVFLVLAIPMMLVGSVLLDEIEPRK